MGKNATATCIDQRTVGRGVRVTENRTGELQHRRQHTYQLCYMPAPCTWLYDLSDACWVKCQDHLTGALVCHEVKECCWLSSYLLINVYAARSIIFSFLKLVEIT